MGILNMSDFNSQLFHRELLVPAIKLTVVTGLSYCAIYWILKQMDPTKSEQRKTAKEKAVNQLKRIGKNELKLTEYELMIASHLVHPSDIDVGWNDIAGLEDIMEDIMETVIFPIKERHLLAGSKLTRPPKGVLLYGPPGCGKTLIAKATAKEAVASFINLDMSILTDKWYGESQKLVTALFSLANKLEPCIIFIDEIDSLLRTRNLQDHEATAMMKAQFMFLWDGLSTDSDKIVILIGATNRPQDLDSAILRRMPASFRIPIPNAIQRRQILKLILDKENITEDVNFQSLANRTDGYSGSELQELCRNGSSYRVRELHRKKQSETDGTKDESTELRSITMDDLEKALKKMKGCKLNYTVGDIILD